MYGGTVFSQALWSAAHGGDPELYIKILETLVATGAKIPERHVPVNKKVDTWLKHMEAMPNQAGPGITCTTARNQGV